MQVNKKRQLSLAIRWIREAVRKGKGQPTHKQEDLGAQADRNGSLSLRGEYGADETQGPGSYQEACHPAYPRQEEGFGQELAQQPVPASSEGGPHGDLGPAVRPPGKEKVRDVCTGDEEDDARDGDEENEGGPGLGMEAALPSRSGLQGDLLRQEPLHGLIAHAGLQGRVHLGIDAPVEGIELGPGLFQGHVGAEPPEEIDPVSPAVLQEGPTGHHQFSHRDGNVYVGPRSEGCSREAFGGDSQNGQGLAVDDDGAVQHGRIGSQMVLPVVMAENRYKMASGCPVVGLME